MLPDTLNTNQVRTSAGVEVELQLTLNEGRLKQWEKFPAVPSKPIKLVVQHQVISKDFKERRRSKIGVAIRHASEVDPTILVDSQAYIVIDTPQGAMNTTTVLADSIAMLLSFVGTTDGTTLLLNGNGNGAQALLNGAM